MFGGADDREKAGSLVREWSPAVRADARHDYIAAVMRNRGREIDVQEKVRTLRKTFLSSP